MMLSEFADFYEVDAYDLKLKDLFQVTQNDVISKNSSMAPKIVVSMK